MNIIISVENIWKQYRLGVINNGHLYRDIRSLVSRTLGREDPWSRIGEESRFDRRGSFWALKDISFEVKQGDCVGILGRNGAGKSTLLKIITRITTPTKGQIKIKGKVTSLLEVGTGFHHELTGRENIYLNGAILGMKKAEIRKKFDQIVSFSEIEDFIDTPVKRYSSGMKVRLAFSVAVHLDSEILITDEVLAVGDMKFRQKCIAKMKEISTESNRTILFVSHNVNAIRKICTTGFILDKGEMIFQCDNINEVADRYIEFIKADRNSIVVDSEQ